MFIKTNTRIKVPYDTLVIKLFGFEGWDNIQTYVGIITDCYKDGELVHNVANTKAMYPGRTKLQAIFKDIKFALNILNKLPKPERIVLQFDLGMFVFLSKQATMPFEAYYSRKERAFRELKKMGIPVDIELVDPSVVHELEDIIVAHVNARKAFPTLEKMGYIHKNFYDKQMAIRRQLCLVKS